MLWIKILIGCQVIRDCGRGFTKHIRHNGIKSHIANGKSVLKTILLTALHRSELIAVAGQLPQDTDILGRNKAAFHQTDAEQIPNPLGILCVILVSFTHLGLAMTTRMLRFSRMLKTGTQYFPVDSMHTSKQLFSWSQSAKRFRSELNVENRFF